MVGIPLPSNFIFLIPLMRLFRLLMVLIYRLCGTVSLLFLKYQAILLPGCFFNNLLNNLFAHLTCLLANHSVIGLRSFYPHLLPALPPPLVQLRVGFEVVGSPPSWLLDLLVCTYLHTLRYLRHSTSTEASAF